MTEQQLILTNRLYKYIKASAIVGCIQASVELITNSHDAYLKSHLNPQHRIDIELNYQTNQLRVYDQAIGLTNEQMVRNFGQVGEYTSENYVRGYFSRGAKDISAIGNVTFIGIKDGKFSKVRLSTHDVFYIDDIDIDVTQEHRDEYGIVNNGLCVIIDVKSSIELPSHSEIKNLGKYYSLRDIFSDPDFFVNLLVLDANGEEVHNDRVVYSDLDTKESLIDVTYKVDGYEGVTASFKVDLLTEPVVESTTGFYQEHGIIVSSGNAIHEISCLYNDISGHPYIRYIVGRIECSYINQLMYDFDANPDDKLNPIPILDHSRINGLDRSHPFTKALFRMPHYQLKYVLQELNQSGMSETKLNSDLSNLFDEVSIFGEGFFKEMLESLSRYSRAESSRITGYLAKKAGSVITSESTAKYNFKDPLYFNEANGNIDLNNPTLNMIFTDKNYDDFPYYIYRIDNVITLEININDFLVSKYIDRHPDTSEIIFKNRTGAELILVQIIAEALAREAIKCSEHNSVQTHTSEHYFSELEKLKSQLTPRLYDIIKTNEIILS